MFDRALSTFPFSHQPFLTKAGELIFCGSPGPSPHRTNHDFSYQHWQIYVASANYDVTPVILPYDVCCSPVLEGRILTCVGGVETPRGLEYHLCRHTLSPEYYVMDSEQLLRTRAGFVFAGRVVSLLSDAKTIVVSAPYHGPTKHLDAAVNLSDRFRQIFRVVPLAEGSNFLVTGESLFGDFRTGMFSTTQANTLGFMGWVVSPEGEHVYKSSIKGNLMVHAVSVGGSIDDRRLTLSGWRLIE